VDNIVALLMPAKTHVCGVDDRPLIPALFSVPFPEWVASAKPYWIALA